jgi:RNA polymerase sigma factor (sigma-70 family)
MSALLDAPVTEPDSDGAASDHRLVAAVRRGDDRGFETLYHRYSRRIHAYVHGMVKDHGRAEDITQEVFVSALRRMRATERPIAFKPWIYEIAKNACIDQFRRSKRAEEVSMDADDALAPSDYGRLVSAEPVPDAALAVKQELDNLCGAFGSLSEAHHQILVLRELEGLSYREIGERMGLSRPAVESTLFRARRRLTEEYDELASGERCVRIQSIISSASTGQLGARDTRRLARHVAHCQPCRREAVAAGVDSALLARKPIRQRVTEKVAALFPFPFLLRGRRGGGGTSGTDAGWAAQLPVLSDHVAAGGAKLAAAAALLVAGLGAGVGTDLGGLKPGDSPARTATTASAQATAAAHTSSGAPAGATLPARRGSVRETLADNPRMGSMWNLGAGAGAMGEKPAGSGVPSSRDGGGAAAGTPVATGDGTIGSGGGEATRPVQERTGPVLQTPQVQTPEVTVPSQSLPAVPINPSTTGAPATGVRETVQSLPPALAPVTEALPSAPQLPSELPPLG